MKLYLILFYGCTEPKVFGPYKDEEERSVNAFDMNKENGNGENCFCKLNIKDNVPTVESYINNEFESDLEITEETAEF